MLIGNRQPEQTSLKRIQKMEIFLIFHTMVCYDSPDKAPEEQHRSLSQFKTRPSAGEIDIYSTIQKKLVQLTGISKIVNVQSDTNRSFNTLAKRRVHQDGVCMLDSHLSMKEQQQKVLTLYFTLLQMTVMENRIKRLMYEEQRARKLQDQAQQKTDKMLQARDRHQKELTDKFRYYEDQKLNMNQQKEKNYQEKLQRKENKQKVKSELYIKKHHIKEEVDGMNNQLKNQKKEYQNEDMNYKKKKKFEILQFKNEHLTKRINNLENHQQSLKQNYSSKLMEKQIFAEEANEKLKKYEQMEMALIERLKSTHCKQQSAYKDLEKVVHDGYGYYLKSFKEKREKNHSLYEHGTILKSRNESIQHSSNPINLTTIEKKPLQQL